MKKRTRYSHLTMEPFNKQIEVPPDFNRPLTPPAIEVTEPEPAQMPVPIPPVAQATEPILPPLDQAIVAPESPQRTYELVIPVVAPATRGELARKLTSRQVGAAPESPAALPEPGVPEDPNVPPPLPDYEPIFHAADIVIEQLSRIAKLKPSFQRPLPAESLESAQKVHYVRPGFTGARTPAARHARKCGICSHPDREAIEFAFIQWHNVDWIARKYRVDPYAVYRHAHAVNLFERRGRNVAAVLEKLMEDAGVVRANPASIIQAVRAYSRITDYVKWVEPPQIHISAASASRSSRRSRRNPSKPKKKRTRIRKTRSFTR